MSRETSALEAVQALVPDDRILDVALTYPRGTTQSEAIGAAAGGVMGFGSDFQGVSAVLGSVAAGKLFAATNTLPQSIVVAVSDTAVYTLGRDKLGLVGGWDEMTKLVKFERSKLHLEVKQRVATLEITLTDTEHDVSLELEAKRLGNLGVKEVVALLLTDPPA